MASVRAVPEAPTSEPSESSPAKGPLRSVMAVAAGWAAFSLLDWLTRAILATTIPDPQREDPAYAPSTAILVAWMIAMLLNGAAGGLVTGRVSLGNRLLHGLGLGALLAYRAMLTSDEVRGLPWWLFVGRIVIPGVAALLGAFLADRVAKRRAL